jgi:hypothetical protein
MDEYGSGKQHNAPVGGKRVNDANERIDALYEQRFSDSRIQKVSGNLQYFADLINNGHPDQTDWNRLNDFLDRLEKPGKLVGRINALLDSDRLEGNEVRTLKWHRDMLKEETSPGEIRNIEDTLVRLEKKMKETEYWQPEQEPKSRTAVLMERCQNLRDMDLDQKDRIIVESMISDIKMGTVGYRSIPIEKEISDIEATMAAKNNSAQPAISQDQLAEKIRKLRNANNEAYQFSVNFKDDEKLTSTRKALELLQAKVLMNGPSGLPGLLEEFIALEKGIKLILDKNGVDYSPIGK